MIDIYWLWHAQGGLCFYCGDDTWPGSAESIDDAKKRLNVSTRKQVHRRRATREHLKRRADGGTNEAANLVMACQECNVSREAKHPLLHLAEMRAP